MEWRLELSKIKGRKDDNSIIKYIVSILKWSFSFYVNEYKLILPPGIEIYCNIISCVWIFHVCCNNTKNNNVWIINFRYEHKKISSISVLDVIESFFMVNNVWIKHVCLYFTIDLKRIWSNFYIHKAQQMCTMIMMLWRLLFSKI